MAVAKFGCPTYNELSYSTGSSLLAEKREMLMLNVPVCHVDNSRTMLIIFPMYYDDAYDEIGTLELTLKGFGDPDTINRTEPGHPLKTNKGDKLSPFIF